MKRFNFLCEALIFAAGFCAAAGSLLVCLVLLVVSAVLNLLADFLGSRIDNPSK